MIFVSKLIKNIVTTHLLYPGMDIKMRCPLLTGMLVMASPVLVFCGSESGMISSRPAERMIAVTIG
jgi:hypothetical protein